ncbi:MAG: ABC transporter permease [Alphaproteobacteria bacterium]|nr:ABC transporter permease [Alphaproteobacteria bacterium]
MSGGTQTTIDPGAAPPRGRRRRIAVSGIVGGLLVVFWAAMAVIGPWIAPYDVGEIAGMDMFGGLSGEFPLGTDFMGRDMLSRILVGARYTVGVALVATLAASAAGTTLGLFAAARGGLADAVLSRLLDAMISMPSKMFALVVVATFGSSIPVLIAMLAIIYTPGCYRLARSMAVNISAMDFVSVARARGESTAFIMRDEILPNMVLPVLTDFGLRFVFVVLLLSGLSFLGLGIQPPNADWGSLVRENMGGLSYAAPAVLMPALAIATLTAGMNMLIDNLPGRRAGGGEGH